MRYLLDTHTLIWYSERNSMLSAKAEKIIDDPKNTIYVSAASLWEIAIKLSIGKLNLSFDNLLDELEMASFQVLPIENVYMQKLINLTQIHKDPFDRLLIATAQVEDMTLITTDENIHKYDVPCVW